MKPIISEMQKSVYMNNVSVENIGSAKYTCDITMMMSGNI